MESPHTGPDEQELKRRAREAWEKLVNACRPIADWWLGIQPYRGERDSFKSMDTGNEEEQRKPLVIEEESFVMKALYNFADSNMTENGDYKIPLYGFGSLWNSSAPFKPTYSIDMSGYNDAEVIIAGAVTAGNNMACGVANFTYFTMEPMIEGLAMLALIMEEFTFRTGITMDQVNEATYTFSCGFGPIGIAAMNQAMQHSTSVARIKGLKVASWAGLVNKANAADEVTGVVAGVTDEAAGVVGSSIDELSQV